MTTGKTTLWPHLHNPAPPPHQTRSTACKNTQLQFTKLNTRQSTGPFKRTYHTSNALVLLTESLLHKIIVNHNTVPKKQNTKPLSLSFPYITYTTRKLPVYNHVIMEKLRWCKTWPHSLLTLHLPGFKYICPFKWHNCPVRILQDPFSGNLDIHFVWNVILQ